MVLREHKRNDIIDPVPTNHMSSLIIGTNSNAILYDASSSPICSIKSHRNVRMQRNVLYKENYSGGGVQ